MDDAPSIALASVDVEIRLQAAERLANDPVGARDSAVLLVRAMADPAEEVRQWAGEALEGLGAPPEGSFLELKTLIAGQESDVAYWAITLIGRLGQEAASAVSALSSALHVTRPPAVRQRAAWALGKIGPAASEALDDLRLAASDADPRLARLASEAMRMIDR